MSKRVSRRQLLKALAAVTGAAGLCRALGVPFLQGIAQELDELVYLPMIGTSGGETPAPTPTPADTPTPTATHTPAPTSTPTLTPTATHTSTPQTPIPPPTEARVVHVHSEQATFWNGETDFWNYVDQSVVHEMVDRGMVALTGTSSVAGAWRTLLPDYQPGQVIAIKVNLNNSYTSCDYAEGKIDALVQPVNAVVRGLKEIGVAEADIWVYDAIRVVPDRFVTGSQYSGIQYFDLYCRKSATFESSDPDALVGFSPPQGVPGPPAIRICDALVDATYLINMPIMKTHPLPGVTLAFKNHFGTIDDPRALHEYITPGAAYYRSDYSPLVDIYENRHIVGKTVLTVGDGLFAANDGNQAPPSPWTSFKNQVPNSLFFATDPVALDSVMCDLIAAEMTLPDTAYDYLVLAEDAHLGVHERGDPWGDGYDLIEYVLIDNLRI